MLQKGRILMIKVSVLLDVCSLFLIYTAYKNEDLDGSWDKKSKRNKVKKYYIKINNNQQCLIKENSKTVTYNTPSHVLCHFQMWTIMLLPSFLSLEVLSYICPLTVLSLLSIYINSSGRSFTVFLCSSCLKYVL